MALVWSFLVCQAVLAPPDSDYWQPLTSILLLQQKGALFEKGALGPALAAMQQPLGILNISILYHLMLRYTTDLGIGLFGLMAYLSIGFSTYSLSRRYAWPPAAFTVTMIVMGMPRLVYLATTPGYRIIPAAAGLFCLLAIYRVVERPNILDLLLLLTAMLFLVAGTAMERAFGLVLVPLTAALLFRRHGTTIWWRLLARHRWSVAAAALPVLVLSQFWILLYDRSHYGVWFGYDAGVPALMNRDGILGTAANLFRYLLQSADFTQPVDRFLEWSLGLSLSGIAGWVHTRLLVPIFQGAGAAEPFTLIWLPDERTSWFGPFGFFLVVPSLLYCLVRAPRRLKTVALALIAYFFLICLIPAWTPENVSYFTILFCCSGMCMAFFLPPWRISRRGRGLLQASAALLLLYAALGNAARPTISIGPLGRNGTPVAESGQRLRRLPPNGAAQTAAEPKGSPRT